MTFSIPRFTIALFATACLQAQDVSWGIQLSGTSPLGNTANNSFSGTHKQPASTAALGANLSYQISTLDDLRFTLNLVNLPGEKKVIASNLAIQNEYTFFQTGFEWVHYFDSRNHGWHAFVGIDLTEMHRDISALAPSPYGDWWGGTSRFNQSKRLGFNIGCGYQVSRWLDIVGSLHQVTLNHDNGAPSSLSNAQWAQAGVIFHLGRQ